MTIWLLSCHKVDEAICFVGITLILEKDCRRAIILLYFICSLIFWDTPRDPDAMRWSAACGA
jgi:hypothetical protein